MGAGSISVKVNLCLPSENRSVLIGKNRLQRQGFILKGKNWSKFVPFRIDPFSGRKGKRTMK